MSQRRSDYWLGFVAGVAFGLAVAMIFLDPCPAVAGRDPVAVPGLVGVRERRVAQRLSEYPVTDPAAGCGCPSYVRSW